MVYLMSTVIILKCSGIAKRRESVQFFFKVGGLYKYEFESETEVVCVLCFVPSAAQSMTVLRPYIFKNVVLM